MCAMVDFHKNKETLHQYRIIHVKIGEKAASSLTSANSTQWRREPDPAQKIVASSGTQKQQQLGFHGWTSKNSG